MKPSRIAYLPRIPSARLASAIALVTFGCVYSGFEVGENQVANTGGNSSAPSSTGGTSLAGSSRATGGTHITGGHSGLGGTASSVTGGSLTTGGETAFISGGSSTTGGATDTGGASWSAGGGSTFTGGATAFVTGGASSASGGATDTGGVSSSASGGLTSTGGATAFVTGGASSASGGASSTAGSGGATTPPNCVVHVAMSGKDTNTGATWSDAFANVQVAITAANSRLTVGACPTVEVWVAAGTYTPTFRSDQSDPRSATFQLMSGVAVYGGFEGKESIFGARDVVNHLTTLSGDIGTPNDASDNVYHVVTGATGATLDGFTVTAGYATGSNDYRGGGMYNNSCSPIVTNCTFSNNTAGGYGGGMLNDNASPTVTGCTFSGNEAASGGGMANRSSSPIVKRCTFSNNTADSYGGGMFNTALSSPTVTDCTFSNNSRAEKGGGMANVSSSAPTVTNCAFLNDVAQNGGGMANDESSPTVVNCLFAGNTGGNDGGGMFNFGASPTVTNCTFSGNRAGNHGGAVNNVSSSPAILNSISWNNIATVSGTEIFNSTSAPSVTFCIVAGGYAGTGNLSSDPLLNTDFTLKAGSPAIDAGGCGGSVALTDILGNSRWDIAERTATNGATGRGVDIGAYEYQGVAGTDSIVSNTACP